VLKRYEDDGRPPPDRPLVDYCMACGIATMQAALAETIDNLPSRPAAWAAKLVAQPAGPTHRGASDALAQRCAELLLAPSPTRDRLTENVFRGVDDDAVALLERAFALTAEMDPLRRRLREAKLENVDEAQTKGLLDAGEAAKLNQLAELVSRVIEVDDFAPEELSPLARRNAP
jgi:acyl-CoA dehydrogenase